MGHWPERGSPSTPLGFPCAQLREGQPWGRAPASENPGRQDNRVVPGKDEKGQGLPSLGRVREDIELRGCAGNRIFTVLSAGTWGGGARPHLLPSTYTCTSPLTHTLPFPRACSHMETTLTLPHPHSVTRAPTYNTAHIPMCPSSLLTFCPKGS